MQRLEKEVFPAPELTSTVNESVKALVASESRDSRDRQMPKDRQHPLVSVSICPVPSRILSHLSMWSDYLVDLLFFGPEEVLAIIWTLKVASWSCKRRLFRSP
jgi:hypothetical protein